MKSLKLLFFSTASLAMSVATIQMALLTETGGWREPCTKSSFTWEWASIRGHLPDDDREWSEWLREMCQPHYIHPLPPHFASQLLTDCNLLLLPTFLQPGLSPSPSLSPPTDPL